MEGAEPITLIEKDETTNQSKSNITENNREDNANLITTDSGEESDELSSHGISYVEDLSHHKKVSMTFIDVNMGDETLPMLIDTGSNNSLINYDLYKLMDQHGICSKVFEESVKLKSGTLSQLDVKGSVIISLSIGGKNFFQTFLIARNLATAGIIGLNFLKANAVTMDYPNDQFLLANAGTAVPMYSLIAEFKNLNLHQ